MSFYQTLIEQTDAERQSLLSAPIIQQALTGQVHASHYLAFLQQAYHHVRHTVPLLMACGSRLPSRLEWLRAAIGEYIDEEMGHQEWVLDDIEACGGDRATAASALPSLATEVMVSYAYDTIQRGNPVGFFGMVLVLEGTSMTLATRAANTLQQSLDLPRNALTYLLSHGSLDIQHVDFFKNLMDQLEDAGDRQAVVHAARRFYILYGNIFRTLDNASGQPAEAA
jgi:thiaminase